MLKSLSRALHLFFSFGASCRFHPTCSAYCDEAYRKHGVFRGTVLSVSRLLRCQPFASWGFDPVPSKGGH